MHKYIRELRAHPILNIIQLLLLVGIVLLIPDMKHFWKYLVLGLCIGEYGAIERILERSGDE